MSREYVYLGCTSKDEIKDALGKGVDLRRKILKEMLMDDEDDSDRIIDLYDEETPEHRKILDQFCAVLCGKTLEYIIENNVDIVMSIQIEISDHIVQATMNLLEMMADADEIVIAMIDELIVCLCGWTMSSLFQQ